MHLVNWSAVCADMRQGGLGIRSLVTLNKAFLGKWSWKFAIERNSLWKQVIIDKYGVEDGGNGRKVKFWKDLWCEDQALKDAFPNLFRLAVNKDQWVCDAWEEGGEVGSWNPLFSRYFKDWEMEEVEGLLRKLHPLVLHGDVEDVLSWKNSKNDSFFLGPAFLNQKEFDSLTWCFCVNFQQYLEQVEYYFSDVNLATTEHLMRFINKDPEGYVPISVVASFKKIKALVSSHSQLATVLRNSTKLVVSEDGKKVRRLHPLTESDMEELQSRIVVAENLPEDHCHQNLMKIFSAVGSVKTIRTCQPQTSNGGASSAARSSKTDNMLFSNKLHAFVEYESIELAEKAVVELNDEGNWRSGLRVRLMHRRVV
ncbi:La-related protein 6B [Vitis vinifera]|uniref:La-related protein 6B n=1 Tax=Vitis vinifera TaxID=29760 RepID=A0A438GA01_VITVI|nr:La-related protein 6B [Vitis vinifera]